MEAFVMKILTPLLIIALVTSSVVTESLHIENKDTENKTKEDCNQDATGIRRIVSYDYSGPEKQCYKHFFARGVPPVGLRDPNNGDIRYICQPPLPQPPPPPPQLVEQTYYATMFDESRGIAVFSAYTLTRPSQARVYKRRAHPWCQTPGIRKQGSQAIYGGKRYERGHLVPSGTLSNSQKRYDSTYTYTNAVPQRKGFNGGQWSTFEKRIRTYARKCTKPLKRQLGRPRQQAGILYLLTGTSFARIDENQNGDPRANFQEVAVNEIGTIATGKINIPNSLWTAGCCVRPNGQYTRSFAVMGNNVRNTHQESLTRQVTVAQLETILTADVHYFDLNNNIGEQNVVLFPGNRNCRNDVLG